MDLTEAFAPSQAGTATDDKTTDYFDFVVSPPPHCASADGNVDEDSFLHRAGCRTTIGFLGDSRLHHDGFIKETNNNTLTALPPVSTITGSLGHITHHNLNRNARNNCHLTGNDPVSMDQSGQDCDYWVTDDNKEQTCNILLEDLNKYCWNAQSTGTSNDHHSGLLVQRRDSPLNDAVGHRDCATDDRQNTDGAIYTLTVLNSEANSMDGLECCKSPTNGSGNDSWTLRSNQLDFDAILNMESSVSIGGGNGDGTGVDTDNHDRQQQQQQQQVVVTANGTTVDNRYTTVSTSQFASDDQSAQFGVGVKNEAGDNNNDWKLSDRNNLQETESAAESLLRNALQGKLYPGSASLSGAAAARILGEAQQATVQQSQDDAMHGCTDDLLLSQLDVDTAYRTADLKNIANEVVESYCNLEPAVCNVSATTVMYTLDPASGSLGTITLPADLAQVGTVTVVTTAPAQQDILHQDTRHTDQQAQSNNGQRQSTSGNQQLQLQGSSSGGNSGGTGRTPGTKPAKKYVRRANRNSANNGAGNGAGSNNAGSGTNASAGSTGAGGTAGSPGSVQQRKERSLHYCSICSKGFKDKYSVNVHIRTHTGEKPFACNLCGKSFRQKAHLAKHHQTHSTQKPSSAAAAQAVSSATSNNNSNGAISNASSSNPGSARGPTSPTAADLQAVVQQQITAVVSNDSTIVTNDCNPTS